MFFIQRPILHYTPTFICIIKINKQITPQDPSQVSHNSPVANPSRYLSLMPRRTTDDTPHTLKTRRRREGAIATEHSQARAHAQHNARQGTHAAPAYRNHSHNDDGVVNVNVIWPCARACARSSCGDTEHNKSTGALSASARCGAAG